MRKAVKWDEKATFFRGIITYLRPALKPCSDGLLRPASSRRGLGPFMGLWNTNANVSQGFFTGHRITFEGAQGRILLWSSKRKCMWASMHFPCCLHTTWNYDGQGQGGLGSIFPTFFDIWKVQIFTSAILLCRLLVFDPRVCNCSNLFWSSSIWSLALAFCTLSWAFWSSNSRSLLVTQSLMRAALASTAFASARRKAL